jgi:hypothetical protein
MEKMTMTSASLAVLSPASGVASARSGSGKVGGIVVTASMLLGAERLGK